MAIADFVHLKVRSAYSLTEGANKVDKIVALAKEKYGFTDELDPSTIFIPFSAMTRMSGIDLNGAHGGAVTGTTAAVRTIRKGASDAVAEYFRKLSKGK